MPFDEITCDECGERNVIKYVPASRTDPGYYEDELECKNCGASLNSGDAEPYDLEDERWANDPRV